MPKEEGLNRFRALDAVASEQGAVLALRICEESGALEPVFIRAFRANASGPNEAALLSIDDRHGMSLGRYVIDRRRLDDALAAAETLDEPSVASTATPDVAG